MKIKFAVILSTLIVLAGIIYNFKSSQADAQPQYYLKVWEHDSYRGEPMRIFPYTGPGAQVIWPDPINDKLSSFKYKLPRNVSLVLYEDRHEGPGSRRCTWRGTGEQESVNEEEMPGFISDDCSAHRFISN